GPTAPTLCDPWATAELAAYQVMRDCRPDLAASMWIPPLAGRLDDAIAEGTTQPRGELVHLIRSGPPALYPTRMPAVDNAVNLTEFFVHHEDILRGEGQVGPQREVPPRLECALWAQLTKSAKLLLRKLDAGVVLVGPGYGRKAVKGPTEAGT